MPLSDIPGPPDDRDRFVHMLEAANQALSFAKGRTRGDLDTDHMLRRALINAIQEIGEAAVRTSSPGRARLVGIPWDQVVKMRNVLVHVYWGVDLDQVWDTTVVDLPPFAVALQQALESWDT